jgi:WD40 repeat protein
MALAQGAAVTPAQHHADQPSVVFYANDTRGELTAVTFHTDKDKATSAPLASVASPVWWRTFYLTPTAASADWVVGVFSGDQKDNTDAPRLFAFDPATKTLHWLTKASRRVRSPVVDSARTPHVFYVAGSTVRRATTSGARDHAVYRAPHGWSITALTVAGKAAPDVALSSTGVLTRRTRTYVVQLAKSPKTVVAKTPGSITALALSPDTKTLAVSRVKPTGDSVLTLNTLAAGGMQKTLPGVGNTSEVSWSADGGTLAVDPQEWGGVLLVDLASGTTSFPTALQPYGGGVFAAAPAVKDKNRKKKGTDH